MNGLKPLDLVKNILGNKSPANKSPMSHNFSPSVTPDGTTSIEEETGVFNERNWSKKIWKMYRMLVYIEKNKIDSVKSVFSSKIRDVATYFAVKYRI
jgi:hypothetical protein